MTRVAFKKWHKNGWASPLAGLIALWTWGQYSHVELIIPKETSHLNLERGFSASAWDNEIRIKPIDFYDGKWDILETDRDIDYDYVGSVLGNGYDYLAIGFWELLPLHLQIKNRGYCSETVSCALDFNECQKDPVNLYNTIKKENNEKVTFNHSTV